MEYLFMSMDGYVQCMYVLSAVQVVIYMQYIPFLFFI
jgi:hypothetical protein